MAAQQDQSVGFIEEVTYNTSPGAVTRWVEFTDAPFDYKPTRVQGKGLRVGSSVARSGRRVQAAVEADGSVSLEAISKGMGLLWKWAMGGATSTLVSGSTYQQVFSLSSTLASFVAQQGLVQGDDGTVDATTFTGVMMDGFDLNFPNADIVNAKFGFDICNLTTATGYAAPSYAASPSLFHHANASLSTGALTAPTTTALGAGGTPVANVIGGSLTLANNLSSVKPIGNAGKKVKPTTGAREISGSLDVDYDSTTFRDAFIADTPFNLVITWTGEALSVGNATLQIIVPEIKFDGDLPHPNGTDRIAQGMKFTGLDNLTAAQPLWIVMRTSDAAL
jgi:hypothetical protein